MLQVSTEAITVNYSTNYLCL